MKPPIDELKKRLTREQFEVTQKNATEPPFKNAYWNNHEAGIYVDVVTGEPLFSSVDKFESGTGWPSFSKTIEKDSVIEKEDRRLFFGVRTEVRSRYGDSHLGHVFKDGPQPTGLRYCMNSASLRFVPVGKLKEEGYGKYLALFAGGLSIAPKAEATPQKLEKAIFAGGCFWCMVAPFEKLKGVTKVISGYTGGHKESPTYEEVSAGGTGHAEGVEVLFNPSIVSYRELLEVFWVNVDPTDPGGQFCDRGEQYRSAIFYRSEEQRKLAQESMEALVQSKRLGEKKVATEITPAKPFYPAEEYHQGYYRKNPIRYKFYRSRCGRDRVLKKLWGAGH